MDFMTDANSFLVPFSLRPLERDYGPYMRGAMWADPDLEEMARLMRLVVNEPDAAIERGQAARAQIAKERHPLVTGAVVRQRLQAIRSASQ
jgi:hypothetical protein